MSPRIPGWFPLSQDQLCHLQNPVQKGNAGRALCIKLLRDCKVVTAVHCTESATFCGCAGPRVTPLLALFSEGRTERNSCPVQGTACATPLTSLRMLSHLLELLLFLVFLPDWDNGRTLCGKHDLCPQFLQISGKYKCRHPESLLLSLEHLLHHGHGLPGRPGQYCRPDSPSEFLLKFPTGTEGFLNWIAELLWLYACKIWTITVSN